MISKASGASIGNEILAALPSHEYNRIAPNLESVRLTYGKVVYHFGDHIGHVYFPQSGMGSLLSVTLSGQSIEIGMAGREGVLGIPVILGRSRTPYQVRVEVQGTALRIKANLLREEFSRRGSLHDLLLSYTYVLLAQLSQSAVCNRFHTVDQRLCRWLLIASDRVDSNKLKFTQDSLAQMLGSRRQGVAEAANKLQKAKLIHYARGRITILDRRGLESACCECYEIEHALHDAAVEGDRFRSIRISP
ncbi:MAG: Crp/Fnr family transcriptional regulator [Acidobacteriota bacterium]